METPLCASEEFLRKTWAKFLDPHPTELYWRAVSGQGITPELLKALPDDLPVGGILKSQSIQRQREWAEGRRAGLEIQHRLGATALQTLSHSSGWILAAGVQVNSLQVDSLTESSPHRIQKIGVDLERVDRILKPETRDRLIARITDEQERALGLQFIELWALKEAALKANPHSARTVESDYRVRAYDPVSGLCRVEFQERIFPSQLVRLPSALEQEQGWVVAFSFF